MTHDFFRRGWPSSMYFEGSSDGRKHAATVAPSTVVVSALLLWPALSWRHRLAAALPIALASSMVAVVASSAAPAHPAPAAAVCPAARPDEAAALITARICSGRVLIGNATTETTEAWALPSGQVERRVAAAPVRVKRDGAWTPVDRTLVEQRPSSRQPRWASGVTGRGPGVLRCGTTTRRR